ncbi:unnamed protein product [Caenorhabditis sp. 36 PRJEB53466]|nr:unnamed protein product [Caenorhabditis sp. 36 PRJEB53466]
MLQFLFLAVLTYSAAAQCLPGDLSFESYCFSFNRVHGSFDDSNNLCIKTTGGHLVTIYNIIENNWIQKFAVSNLDADYDYFWIGASDRAKTYNWTWNDGTALNFTNWGPGEPLEDRHCGTMQLSTGKWFTEVCSVKHQFVCQYPQSGGPTGIPFTCPTCPTCSK